MTIGSDQLDAWGRTLIECDELYREVQLLIRINPEAYSVDSDALATVGVANSDGADDAGLLHPIVFARRWAWYLAAADRAIPPITNAWVPLIRYVAAHLQYLAPADKEWFAADLRRLRGQLGAYVNENGLSQGEEVRLSALRGRDARAKLRAWARSKKYCLPRKHLAVIFPELTNNDWHALRMRKVRSDEDIPARMYPACWVADRGSVFDTTPVPGYAEEYTDVFDRTDMLASYDSLDENMVQRGHGSIVAHTVRPGKRQTQERFPM